MFRNFLTHPFLPPDQFYPACICISPPFPFLFRFFIVWPFRFPPSAKLPPFSILLLYDPIFQRQPAVPCRDFHCSSPFSAAQIQSRYPTSTNRSFSLSETRRSSIRFYLPTREEICDNFFNSFLFHGLCKSIVYRGDQKDPK